jgi:hypothetical protein
VTDWPIWGNLIDVSNVALGVPGRFGTRNDTAATMNMGVCCIVGCRDTKTVATVTTSNCTELMRIEETCYGLANNIRRRDTVHTVAPSCAVE